VCAKNGAHPRDKGGQCATDSGVPAGEINSADGSVDSKFFFLSFVLQLLKRMQWFWRARMGHGVTGVTP
jgi:hypothetical protein